MLEVSGNNPPLNRWPGWAGALASLIGIVALSGWAFSSPFLKSILLNHVAMQPITGVALILSGVALFARSRELMPEIVQTGIALLVIVLGLQTIFQFAFDIDLGTDRLLFTAAITDQDVPLPHPGRMSEAAALAFILIGFALLLARDGSRFGKIAFSACATAILFVVAPTLLGFLFHAAPLSEIFGISRIAFHTAIGLAAVSLGLLCLRPDAGWVRLLSGPAVGAAAARRLLPLVIMVPILVSWLAYQGNEVGLFSSEIRLALTTTVTMALLIGLTIWTATRLNDLEAIRKTERALLQTERQLEAVLENASVAILSLDQDGCCVYMNTAAEELTGFTADEVKGRPILKLLGAPHTLDWRDCSRHSEAMLALRPQRGEAAFLNKQGERFAASYIISPIEDAGEAPAKLILELRDLSEERAAKEKLAQTEAELRQMSRISAMGAMGSTLAHELNQPLTAVKNYLSAARRIVATTNGHADLVTAVEEAHGANDRAINIISRLRTFMSHGTVAQEEVDLRELIANSCRLALSPIQRNQIETKVTVTEPARWVLVDPVQIEQVLTNLVRNATEAMAASQRRQLQVRAELLIGGMVEVTVQDTGSGFSDVSPEAIFSSFRSTKATGMGLGLSICRTIIEAHGGKISASDAPEGGAMFRLTIPAAWRLAGARKSRSAGVSEPSGKQLDAWQP